MIDYPVPRNPAEVRQFLGMVNYFGKFIPNLSDMTNHLRLLLKKNVMFTWNKNHDESFEKLKKVLTSEPVLAFFDVSLKSRITTDASSYGLGGSNTPTARLGLETSHFLLEILK